MAPLAATAINVWIRAQMTTTTRPLNGLRVLDLSQGVAGPHCGGLFAEYGAEVIKIEPPTGDWMRVLGAGYDGRSGSFIYYNRGKKSLCLLISSPTAAIEIVLGAGRATSDVVIDNNRPRGFRSFGDRFRSAQGAAIHSVDRRCRIRVTGLKGLRHQDGH